MYSSTRCYCHFRINAKHLYSKGWDINDRYLWNSDLGRWSADVRSCIHLKLSNTSAGVVFQRTVDRLVEMFMLKVSCSRRVTDSALILQRYEEDYFTADILRCLRSNSSPGSKEIVAGEARTLSEMAGWLDGGRL